MKRRFKISMFVFLIFCSFNLGVMGAEYSSEESARSTASISFYDSKEEEALDNGLSLPKTGEDNNNKMTALGVIITGIIFLQIIYLRRKKI